MLSNFVLKNNANFNVRKKLAHKFIDNFTQILEKKIIKINYFNVAKKEVFFYIKKSILNSFSYRESKFSKKNSIFYLPYHIGIFIFYSFYIFIFSNNKTKIKKFELLVDNLESDFEISLYKDLNKLKKKFFFRFLNKILSKKKKIFFPKYKGYYLNLVDFFFLYSVLYHSIKVSIALKFNFVYYSLKLVDEILYFRNFFKKNNPKNIIMHQHYYSNNIKNYFFKLSGGKSSCVIQKNINNLNTNSFFYHADIFFSIGEYTAVNNQETNSKVVKNIPVGSLFMNHSKDKINEAIKRGQKKYDVLFLGGNNLMPGNSYYDTYSSYKRDYLENFNWLIKLKKKFPGLKIAFKHHSNNNNDYEAKLLKKHNIEIVKQIENSYVISLQSNFICSWNSTMIVEMKILNPNSFFLDPGYRNDQFLKPLINSNFLRIKNFTQFEKAVLKSIKIKKNFKIYKKYLNFNKDYNQVLKNICLNLKII